MYTLIIGTHNRHDLLLRAIDYYQHFDCDVFIADSSDSKLSYKFPDNIIYKHFPRPAALFAEKIYETAKSITTPYVCLVPDDDYLLESSLKLASCFLDDNQDYVSAQGKYYKFELIKNQVTFSPRYDLGSTHYAVESEDRLSRLARAFNPYFHQIYSVHRTDVFTKTWKFDCSVCKTGSYKDFALDEFLVQLVPMCHGKHKVLPILWMVRDTYTFDSTRAQKYLVAKSKLSSIGSSYRWDNRSVNEVEFFFNSKECGLIKENFGEIIFELIGNKEESDKLFDVACKSFTQSFLNNRNKVNIKMMIKLFVPTLVSTYFIKRRKLRHMGGVETTSSAKDALAKIRLSVLTFRKCYDTDVSRIIK